MHTLQFKILQNANRVRLWKVGFSFAGGRRTEETPKGLCRCIEGSPTIPAKVMRWAYKFSPFIKFCHPHSYGPFVPSRPEMITAPQRSIVPLLKLFMRSKMSSIVYFYSRGLMSGAWNGYLTKSPQKSSFWKKVSLISASFEKLSKENMEGLFCLVAIWKKMVLSRHQVFKQMAKSNFTQCLSYPRKHGIGNPARWKIDFWTTE